MLLSIKELDEDILFKNNFSKLILFYLETYHFLMEEFRISHWCFVIN